MPLAGPCFSSTQSGVRCGRAAGRLICSLAGADRSWWCCYEAAPASVFQSGTQRDGPSAAANLPAATKQDLNGNDCPNTRAMGKHSTFIFSLWRYAGEFYPVDRNSWRESSRLNLLHVVWTCMTSVWGIQKIYFLRFFFYVLVSVLWYCC